VVRGGKLPTGRGPGRQALTAPSCRLQTRGTCRLLFFFPHEIGTQAVPVWFSITVGARSLCVQLVNRSSALKEFCIDKTDKDSIILLFPTSYRETEKLNGKASSTGKLHRVCEVSAVKCPSLGSFSDDLKGRQQKEVPLPAVSISDPQPRDLTSVAGSSYSSTAHAASASPAAAHGNRASLRTCLYPPKQEAQCWPVNEPELHVLTLLFIMPVCQKWILVA